MLNDACDTKENNLMIKYYNSNIGDSFYCKYIKFYLFPLQCPLVDAFEVEVKLAKT